MLFQIQAAVGISGYARKRCSHYAGRTVKGIWCTKKGNFLDMILIMFCSFVLSRVTTACECSTKYGNFATCYAMVRVGVNTWELQVHLAPKFFLAKTNLLVIRNTSGKNFWIRLNPRFPVPRRNLESSTKNAAFCFTAEFEENGYSGYCDVYLGRLNLWRPNFLQDSAIHIRKVCRNAFQKCYRLLQQYPRFKERYTVQFTVDDRSMTQ